MSLLWALEKLLLSSPSILASASCIAPPWSGDEIVYVSFLVEANSVYLFIQEIKDSPYGYIFPLGVAHSSEN